MILCLICKRPLEIAKNHIEQVKRGNTSVEVCSSCQAKILFEAKNQQKHG